VDHATRKHYKQRAAQAVAQGWKAISVDPAHLLTLVLEYTPPPPPTEMDRLLQLEKDIVRSRDLRIRDLERAARTAQERGRAEGARESAEEIRRLRDEVVEKTAALNELERTGGGGGARRARAVGTPI
jgi:hypothetical protein